MAGTILCVDADRQQCGILERALKDHGYEVQSAHDGNEALQRIAAGGIDLAISDFTLPRRDGFALLEAVRALPAPTCALPMLYTTATRPTPEQRERAKANRARAILGKPVAVDRLLELVARVLAQAPAAAPAKPPVDPRPKRVASQLSRVAREAQEHQLSSSDSSPQFVSGAMRLEGKLRENPLPLLLHRIHELRSTGVLMFTNGNKKKAVQLREGYPVAVKSNLVGECLGNYLVKRGVITRSAFDESTARLKNGQGMQGEILIAMDVLDEADVSEALGAQALEKLYELFEWRGGRFNFEVGGRLRKANSIALDRSPANVIFEGVRTRYPLDRIDTHLELYAELRALPCEEPFKKLQDVDLGAAETKLLGRLEARPLVSSLLLEDEAERRALFAFFATGMVEMRDGLQPAVQPVGEPVSIADDVDSGVARALEDTRRPPPAPNPTRAPEVAPLPPAAVQPAPRAERRARVGADISLTNALPEDDRALRAELAATAEKLRRETFFQMLRVDSSCDGVTLREAFETRAQRFHPDRFTHSSSAVRQLADEVFQRLERAYATLSDPKRAKEYESDLERNQQQAAEDAAGQKALEAEVEFQRGEALMRKRSYEAALLCFGNALQRAPQEGEYHAHYGWCLYNCHPDETAMIEEAIEHVRRGLKLARDQEKPYLYLGRLYKATGREGAAEKMFTRAVQVCPDSVEALRELRLIAIRKEKSKGLIGRLLRR